MISNLIVDQTSTNPAAIAAAGFPVRTQGNPGVVPCTTDPDPLATRRSRRPADCTPSHETLFIPNVTTDVGLSPPYNSLFTLFGQFFDHGVDQTVKGGGTVFVPLKADDPLIAGPDHIFGNARRPAGPNLRFMVLTRGKNQPGPDGVLGTADDVQDAINTDSPGSTRARPTPRTRRTRCSCASTRSTPRAGRSRPGSCSAGLPAPTAGRHGHLGDDQDAGSDVLGLQLVDKDVTGHPDARRRPYGKFVPGPARGLPQYMTDDRPGRGQPATPVPVPANALHFDTPFLTDIAHSADADHGHDATRTRGRRRTRTTQPRPTSPASRPAPTTTSCWTRTSSPVTAGSTRTSA